MLLLLIVDNYILVPRQQHGQQRVRFVRIFHHDHRPRQPMIKCQFSVRRKTENASKGHPSVRDLSSSRRTFRVREGRGRRVVYLRGRGYDVGPEGYLSQQQERGRRGGDLQRGGHDVTRKRGFLREHGVGEFVLFGSLGCWKSLDTSAVWAAWQPAVILSGDFVVLPHNLVTTRPAVLSQSHAGGHL